MTTSLVDKKPVSIDPVQVSVAAVIGGVVGAAGSAAAPSTALGEEITQGQINSWSNLRNSSSWLFGQIVSNVAGHEAFGEASTDTSDVISSWLTYLLSC